MSATVYLLGAGASRSSKFPGTQQYAPPIMKDFIKIGRALTREYSYEPLWTLLNQRYGITLQSLELGNPNLEEIFTLFDMGSQLLWYDSLEDYLAFYGDDFRFAHPKDVLSDFIYHVLSKICSGLADKSCSTHDLFVQLLCPRDIIISFNYDLILDFSLKKTKRWSEYDGYGFVGFSRDTSVHTSDIKLLKPHGSLNWKAHKKKDDKDFKHPHPLLFSGEYDFTIVDVESEIEKDWTDYVTVIEYGNKLWEAVPVKNRWKLSFTSLASQEGMPCIVPPTVNKLTGFLRERIIRNTWSQVYKALRSGNTLVAIGYSFPSTDAHVNMMIREALNGRSEALNIILVNPDTSIIGKVEQLFSGLIQVVNHYENFAEFLGSPPKHS